MFIYLSLSGQWASINFYVLFQHSIRAKLSSFFYYLLIISVRPVYYVHLFVSIWAVGKYQFLLYRSSHLIVILQGKH